ncbi:hypothetical protein K2X89_17220, partial [Myxococcota bacterium]|nr:hypothetical protein [Myxococcota bacterium]
MFVPGSARAESYQRRRRKIPAKPYPPLDRLDHGKRIRREINSAVDQGLARRNSVQIRVEGANPGLYFEFESFGPDGVPLRIESLESAKAGIEVVAVHREEGVERATVVVPDDQVGYFLKRVEQYLNEATEKGEPKHKPLVESIGAVRLATLRALWTEEKEELPESNESTWWEIWLRRTDDLDLARLRAYAD